MSTVNTGVLHAYDAIPDELLLGKLCWYSVPESATTSYYNFVALLLANGINDVSPPQPRGIDVFKRACTAAEHKVKEIGATFDPAAPELVEYTNVRYMIRPSGHDSDYVWRTIVREQLDAGEHVLAYQNLGKIKYVRSDGTILLEGLSPTHTDKVKDIVAGVRRYYNENIDLLTAYGIREFTRRNLEGNLHAICVRPSGGIYFVQRDHFESLAAIETVVNSVPDATFHSLPLIDDSKQREMLRLAFEEESVGEVDRLLGDMAEILKDEDKKVTEKRFLAFKEEYDQLRTKVADYSDLLDTAMVSTASRLEIMQDSLMTLLGRVK